MLQLLVAYPEVLNAFMTGAACVVGGLLSVVVYLVKASVDRLNDTITKIMKKQDESEVNMQSLEVRLAEQETICDVCRKSCPLRDGPEIHDRRADERRKEV